MEHAQPHSPHRHLISSIARNLRWQVLQRLQELDISCACSEDGMWVDLNTPTAALQLWSVLQHLTASRQQLITQLEDCWRLLPPPSNF